MVDAVLLLGPTACGKSALTMRLAREIPLEIVSVDLAQVYRDMDIGTAKPSASERASVTHHLIDIREPPEPYSAAEFVCDAKAAIGEIREHGKLPLLAGGTIFVRKRCAGLSDLPSASRVAPAASHNSSRIFPLEKKGLVQLWYTERAITMSSFAEVAYAS